MWPFSSRNTRHPNHKNELPFTELPSDLSQFGINDSCIKLWLPEKLTLALEDLSSRTLKSRPDVLRWLFFEHVYGKNALEKLKEWKKKDDLNRVESSLDMGECEFSRKRDYTSERKVTIQLLGKSVDDFKLWVPRLLKNKLEELAKYEDLNLSDYLRKTLFRILFGESFHHKWRTMVGNLPSEVKHFEQEDHSEQGELQ